MYYEKRKMFGLLPVYLFCYRLGQIMKTPYGEMWEFSSNQPDNVSDSAYTSEALGPHTDGTYFALAPG